MKNKLNKMMVLLSLVLSSFLAVDQSWAATCSGTCSFMAREEIGRISRGAGGTQVEDFESDCRAEGGNTTISGQHYVCVVSENIKKLMKGSGDDHFEARKALRSSCKSFDSSNGGQGYGYLRNVSCKH